MPKIKQIKPRNILYEVLKNKTSHISIQFFRYGISGIVAFLIDFCSLVFLTECLNMHYLFSAVIAFTMGLLTVYYFSIFWVFNKRRLSNKLLEIWIFALIGLGGIAFNELFIWLFTEKLLFHYTLSKICSTALIYPYNFFTKKYTLFR